MIRTGLMLLGVALVGGCAASAAPEPFEPDRRIAYIAVETEGLSRFYGWLKDQPGAPDGYESVDLKFRNACGDRARMRLRFGARSELARAPLQPSAPGWSFTAADLIAPGTDDPGPLAFYETTLSGYAAFALTSAGGRYIDFPAAEPRAGFEFGEARAVYLGAYRVRFDPVTGAAALVAAADGPSLDGPVPRPLEPVTELCSEPRP